MSLKYKCLVEIILIIYSKKRGYLFDFRIPRLSSSSSLSPSPLTSDSTFSHHLTDRIRYQNAGNHGVLGKIPISGSLSHAYAYHSAIVYTSIFRHAFFETYMPLKRLYLCIYGFGISYVLCFTVYVF